MNSTSSSILYIFTRTPLHVGAGSSVGAIDQPIQRERHTGFPTIPGSSIKGVLRDNFRGASDERAVFGEPDLAGGVSFGDARLLAFPVRSAKGAFAFATSPLTLQRFARDTGMQLPIPPAPADMTCLAGERLVIDRNGQKALVIEEYRFSCTGPFPEKWEQALSSLLQDAVLSAAAGRFVLLSDGDLSHFAVNACQVAQHVRIDDTTGTADGGGLFNEETVPSECLFYAPLTGLRQDAERNSVFTALASEQLVQFGGSGTTGLGFCTVKLGN